MSVRNAALIIALAALFGVVALLWHGRRQEVASVPPPPQPEQAAPSPVAAANPSPAAKPSQGTVRDVPMSGVHARGLTDEEAQTVSKALQEMAPPVAADPIKRQDELARKVRGHIVPRAPDLSGLQLNQPDAAPPSEGSEQQ